MSLVVRVVAPTGRDAELITDVLRQHGVSAEAATVTSLPLSEPDHKPIGPLLVAEEALNADLVKQLGSEIRAQPPWSDLPILILTRSARETGVSWRSPMHWAPLGSPILLERPIRIGTLVSSVQAALRARIRQYEIRDTLSELREERETLQVMLDNLPVGVVLARSSGEIVRANRSLEAILRHPLLPTPTVEAHGVWVAFHPDGTRVSGREFPLQRAMEQGHAILPEHYVYQRGDGSVGWISMAAAPIFDEKGVVTGGVATVEDIDQQKRSETALIQSEKLAAVGRLAASISHEINNPLEAVTNLLYLAKQDPSLSEETLGYLDSADSELGRVSQIVSHTLRFHRQATKPRAVLAKDLVDPVLGLYSGRLTNAHVRLVVEHKGVQQVDCYEGEIRQVLNNLIGNAIESMRDGGRLRVRTSDSRLWRSGAAAVRITVADEGCGMAPEVLTRIFDAFYTTKGHNGTGLGLWISKGIVVKHQGVLHVRSSLNAVRRGTTFSLVLPLEAFSAEEDDAVPFMQKNVAAMQAH